MSLSIGFDCSFGGCFPNLNLTCKENSVDYSLLIDMFGKAEMWVKRLTVLTGD